MGVNEIGDLYYNPDFINPLSDEEIEGCLLHEILHLALRHLIRCGTRDKEIFNISADLCVNWLVNKNDYYLPKGALLPDREGNFEMAGIKVENIGNKSAEIVYDEFN
jgi:predicted metal-dependent peptidase